MDAKTVTVLCLVRPSGVVLRSADGQQSLTLRPGLNEGVDEALIRGWLTANAGSELAALITVQEPRQDEAAPAPAVPEPVSIPDAPAPADAPTDEAPPAAPAQT